MAAAMATSFDTFRFPQTRPHSQFISYPGPPAPKPASRRSPPKKTPSIADEWHEIDKILGIGVESNTTSHGIEVVDLTCLDGGVNDEIGYSSDNGGGSDFCSQDERENVQSKQSGSPRKVDVERRDENLNQPAIAESQENAIDLDEYQTEPETDTDHEVDHPPREEHNSTQKGNQLEGWGMLAPEYLEKECPPTGMEDVVNSEIVKGAGTQDDLLPCTSDGGEVTKSVRFADRLSMPDTECRDTADSHHVISEVDRDARSDCLTDQPTRGAIGHTYQKATAHQRQPPRKEKAKRQGEFTALENVSCSNHGDSNGGDGDDGDDDDDNYDRTTGESSLSSKRKRCPHADPIVRKRHSRTSNTASKRHFEHASRSAKRQKPSPFRGRPPSNDNLSSDTSSDTSSGNSRDESDEESGHRRHRLPNNERLKSTASLDRSRRHNSKRSRRSVRPSRPNTESTFLAKGASPGHTPRQLPDIAIHPLSSNMAFLTALFRNCGEMGTLSSSQAVTLLENHVGHPTKLDNITVKPLALGIWFLTCFMCYPSDTAGRRTDQLAPAPPNLPATWADAVSPRDDDQSSSDVGDESSSGDDDNNGDDRYSSNGDNNDKYLSNNNDEPSSSRKRSPWSQEDEDRLRKWKKEEGRPWDWICSRFPGRSPGAVRVRWYTKVAKENISKRGIYRVFFIFGKSGSLL